MNFAGYNRLYITKIIAAQLVYNVEMMLRRQESPLEKAEQTFASSALECGRLFDERERCEFRFDTVREYNLPRLNALSLQIHSTAHTSFVDVRLIREWAELRIQIYTAWGEFVDASTAYVRAVELMQIYSDVYDECSEDYARADAELLDAQTHLDIADDDLIRFVELEHEAEEAKAS